MIFRYFVVIVNRNFKVIFYILSILKCNQFLYIDLLYPATLYQTLPLFFACQSSHTLVQWLVNNRPEAKTVPPVSVNKI